MRLDCESRESTRACLLQLFQCTEQALDDVLRDSSLREEYDRRGFELEPFDQAYYSFACERLGEPRLPQELCWFHGTRVPPGTSFAEGILPLGARLPQLRELILQTLPEERDRQEVIRAFAREEGLAIHFRSKVARPEGWGPFAMFVRELALQANETSQHSYLGMPEIIVDLCAEVEAACGRDLTHVFVRAWRPAIVKFVTPAFSPTFHVMVALCYLHSCALDGRPGMSAIANFDGNNQAVPRSAILRVDYVWGNSP